MTIQELLDARHTTNYNFTNPISDVSKKMFTRCDCWVCDCDCNCGGNNCNSDCDCHCTYCDCD